MKRRQEREAEEALPPGPGAPVLAARFIKTLLVLVVIFYVATLVLSRTAGFRTLVEERLGRELETKIRLKGSHLTLGLNLVLDGLRTEETGAVVRAQATARRAVVVWHLPRPWGTGAATEVTLGGVEVDMAWQGGAWHPRAFADASDLVASQLQLQLPDQKKKDAVKPRSRQEEMLAQTAEPDLPSWTGPRMRIELLDGHLEWWTDQPSPVAEVAGLHLTLTPLDVPGRTMTHYLLEAAQVLARGQPLAAPFRMEMLDAGDQHLMLGLTAGQAPPR